MSMQLNQRVKPMDERNAFDIKNSNRASLKAFTKNLAENPEPAPVNPLEGPRSKGGILETADVTRAREAMVAAKLEAQETKAKDLRFNGISQDAATVAAILNQWKMKTPEFVNTPHNALSLVHAIDQYIYNAGIISIAALDDIFQHLANNNYLERSGHVRVRGQGGVMASGPVKLFPVFQTPEEKQDAKMNEAATVVTDRAAEDAANRELSLSELAAKARAGYKKNPRDIRVI